MNQLTHSEFLLQVISTNGVIRGKNLIDDLELQNFDLQITAGVVPSASDIDTGKLHSKFLTKLIISRNIRLGEVGCALAHQKCAANFIESKSEYGIILEDDAEILKDFDLELLKKNLDTSEPRIIILGWIPGFAVVFENSRKNANELYQLVTPTTCTFAYAYNKSAAKLLQNFSSKIIDLADWPIYIYNKVNFFIVDTPWVSASHDPADSTIGKRIDRDYTTIKFRLINGFRILVNLNVLILIMGLFKRQLTIRQIFHRLILRDLFYRYGRANMTPDVFGESNSNLVIASNKIAIIARFFTQG